MHTYMHTEINSRQNIAQCTNIIQFCANTLASESMLSQVITFYVQLLKYSKWANTVAIRDLVCPCAQLVFQTPQLGAQRTPVRRMMYTLCYTQTRCMCTCSIHCAGHACIDFKSRTSLTIHTIKGTLTSRSHQLRAGYVRDAVAIAEFLFERYFHSRVRAQGEQN